MFSGYSVSSAAVVFACVTLYAILAFFCCHRDAFLELEWFDSVSGTSENTPQKFVSAWQCSEPRSRQRVLHCCTADFPELPHPQFPESGGQKHLREPSLRELLFQPLAECHHRFPCLSPPCLHPNFLKYLLPLLLNVLVWLPILHNPSGAFEASQRLSFLALEGS